MIIAVIAALASAATFAVGSALQHRAASAIDNHQVGAEMVRALLHRRSWLFGLFLSSVAFGLHAVALSQGDLAVVQPVIVSGVVFAVIFRAALDRHLPSGRMIAWLIATWAGLALFIVARSRSTTSPDGVHHEVMFLAVGGGVALLVGGASIRMSADRLRGLALGGAAGILFGLVAGLTKLATVQFAAGGVRGAVTHWSLWGLLVVGLAAVVLNQLAYQRARLSITAPMLNIAQVLVAMTFGVVVFGELPELSSVGSVALQCIGLAAMGLGIWQLATHQARDDESVPSSEAVQSDPRRHTSVQ